MNYLKTNWKTTAAGLGMLLTVALRWYSTGQTPSFDEALAVLGAFGLLAAKDANVMGGNVQQ